MHSRGGKAAFGRDDGGGGAEDGGADWVVLNEMGDGRGEGSGWESLQGMLLYSYSCFLLFLSTYLSVLLDLLVSFVM